jgi:hypothetical protein
MDIRKKLQIKAVGLGRKDDLTPWQIAGAEAAARQLWASERALIAGGRLRDAGARLAAELPAVVNGCRGFQMEAPGMDAYAVGMDADSDRWSPEELVAAHTPRAPRRWVPAEEGGSW